MFNFAKKFAADTHCTSVSVDVVVEVVVDVVVVVEVKSSVLVNFQGKKSEKGVRAAK